MSASPSWDHVLDVEPSYLLTVALLAGFLVLVVQWMTATGFFDSPTLRLPRELELVEIGLEHLPPSSLPPFRALAHRLEAAGFLPQLGHWQLPGVHRSGYRVFLTPFVHPGEQALFVMVLAANWRSRVELMLHVISPVSARRVETSTLEVLGHLRPPPNVDLRLVLEADTIEEIWSQHRRALTDYQREERGVVDPDQWADLFRETYQAWIEAGIRAQRVRLAGNANTYRIRERWEWD